MTQVSNHPSREDLTAYSVGRLPEDQAVAIDNHISECKSCSEIVVGNSQDDTFIAMLKEAGQSPAEITADNTDSAPSSADSGEIPAELVGHPRYEVLRLIGRGGMGDVYHAKHRVMDRNVALKVIRPELMRKPSAVERFHREVKAAGRLSHPNIVTAHDAEQAGGVHFLVMEYVDGIDLSRKISIQGSLSIARACNYIRQAALGLQHAHELGMVHRDIKPHNLMLTNQDTVKVLDFGLASVLASDASGVGETLHAGSDLTMTGTTMGTPEFISPEQAEDATTADIRSDIYSLGATLYFLLTGRPPFAEGTVSEKLHSHAHATPDSLISIREEIPVELADVVSKMLAKNPDDRFQSPLAVAEALELFTSQSNKADMRKKQKRRLVRFGMKSLLLLMLLLAVTITIGSRFHNNIIARQDLLNSLTDRGARITTQPGWASQNLPKPVLAALNGLADGEGWSQLVTEISFQRGEVDEEYLAKFRLFPELQKLDLSYCKLSDSDLTPLASLKELRELNLGFNPIGNKGVNYLSGLSRLEYLGLRKTNVGDEGLAKLSSLTELQKLDLGMTTRDITDDGLAHLRGLTELKYLGLWEADITDAGLVHLGGLEDLEELELSETRISGPGFANLSKLTRLKKLKLWCAGVGDAELAHLQGLKDLEFLNVVHTNITGQGLVHLSKLSKLDELKTWNANIVDDDLVHLKDLANLRRLVLGKSKVSDDGLMHLRPLSNLQYLNVEETEVTAAAADDFNQGRVTPCNVVR